MAQSLSVWYYSALPTVRRPPQSEIVACTPCASQPTVVARKRPPYRGRLCLARRPTSKQKRPPRQRRPHCPLGRRVGPPAGRLPSTPAIYLPSSAPLMLAALAFSSRSHPGPFVVARFVDRSFIAIFTSKLLTSLGYYPSLIIYFLRRLCLL
ncbi:hypothetical protein M011DRAFT_188486 [Sporormia fimetaria CBS 119925]|uniref:Uncharacterized protein n=1 Tax=Sporormia fimetaria CBS 119925 TaxID=1340428 RepID=A0A6A6VMB4_9PLEO|nr:hypothetical protein M011DRAFT_188486 [Sporormia fimetaria CBS 119925]